jgi:tellurium resistance protein TerZ
MTISLSKGQKLNLTKGSPGLSKVFMGLGWDVAKKKGLFGKLFGGAAENIDLDASVILFDATKTAVDTVYFRQLKSADGSVRHGGDNLTGAGDGDDEVIYVNLSTLPANVVFLVFTVNSFRGQTFNEVDNAVARLVNETNGQEICRYALHEQGAHTGVIMASMSKGPDGWTMTAHGKPCQGRTASDLAGDARSVI